VQDADSPYDGSNVVTTELVSPATVDTRIVVDVRQASEQTTWHLPHAELIKLGGLAR